MELLFLLIAALAPAAIFDIGVDTDVYTSVVDAFASAFISAAIPEELAKFTMLWLLLRKNPFFDEKFDGIVYSVCIAMVSQHGRA